MARVCAFVLLALVSTLALCAAPAAAITDVDILNFALNLEYLEAEFYSWAAYGHGLNASLRGGGPAALGGAKAYLGKEAQKIAEDIATDEITHVATLRAALGKAAVPAPVIVLEPAFKAAANAAFGHAIAPSFNPFASDITFYHGAFIFEDVGVTAYKGAAAAIQNKNYLTVAAGILGVEGYHAGAIRTLLFQEADKIVNPYFVNVSTIVNAIANLRAKVSGANDDGGVVGPMGDFNLVNTDAVGGVFSRNVSQVLSIVYLGGKTRGGFFPFGLNGNIK